MLDIITKIVQLIFCIIAAAMIPGLIWLTSDILTFILFRIGKWNSDFIDLSWFIKVPIFFFVGTCFFFWIFKRATIKKISNYFKNKPPPLKSKETENEEIIYAYNRIKGAVPDYKEPNYTLAEKVFKEFNDFNLKNLNEINLVYHDYIPKSLLPYPKNYIKCAYYIYLEQAKKNKDLKIFNIIQDVGSTLFLNYPDYDKYRENLKKKKWMDDALKDISPNPKEQFKKLYGVYVVSEEDYYASPSSVDCIDEKLIHDFGFLPEIEEDADWDKAFRDAKK